MALRKPISATNLLEAASERAAEIKTKLPTFRDDLAFSKCAVFILNGLTCFVDFAVVADLKNLKAMGTLPDPLITGPQKRVYCASNAALFNVPVSKNMLPIN